MSLGLYTDSTRHPSMQLWGARKNGPHTPHVGIRSFGLSVMSLAQSSQGDSCGRRPVHRLLCSGTEVSLASASVGVRTPQGARERMVWHHVSHRSERVTLIMMMRRLGVLMRALTGRRTNAVGHRRQLASDDGQKAAGATRTPPLSSLPARFQSHDILASIKTAHPTTFAMRFYFSVSLFAAAALASPLSAASSALAVRQLPSLEGTDTLPYIEANHEAVRLIETSVRSKCSHKSAPAVARLFADGPRAVCCPAHVRAARCLAKHLELTGSARTAAWTAAFCPRRRSASRQARSTCCATPAAVLPAPSPASSSRRWRLARVRSSWVSLAHACQ